MKLCEKENISDPSFGVLVISIDFELYWGMRDRMTLDRYGENILGARNAVNAMLQMFGAYNIHATWATVGFLFFEDTDCLRVGIPDILPDYSKEVLSPYRYIEDSGKLDGDYHFAPELIELIKEQKGQEIGTHTFSHYYCLEEGQTSEAFRDDLTTAVKIAESKGIRLKSLVFPRNQWNQEYLSILNKIGIKCYRGNENGWIYRAVNGGNESRIRRAVRLIDSYLNLSGHHTYKLQECIKERPFNIPSSRFLRPCMESLTFLESLRLKRILKAMKDAAMKRKVFHIWWHPHNFGVNTTQNMAFLKRILDYFSRLREDYGMQSLNMGELSELLEADTEKSFNEAGGHITG